MCRAAGDLHRRLVRTGAVHNLLLLVDLRSCFFFSETVNTFAVVSATDEADGQDDEKEKDSTHVLDLTRPPLRCPG